MDHDTRPLPSDASADVLIARLHRAIQTAQNDDLSPAGPNVWRERHDKRIAAMQDAAEALAELAALRAENERLRAALRPFVTWKHNGDDDAKDWVEMRGVGGVYCLPDSHGFEMVWADEIDGGRVEFTMGQFRRARAAYNNTVSAPPAGTTEG